MSKYFNKGANRSSGAAKREFDRSRPQWVKNFKEEKSPDEVKYYVPKRKPKFDWAEHDRQVAENRLIYDLKGKAS
jgi:hypothetical protein